MTTHAKQGEKMGLSKEAMNTWQALANKFGIWITVAIVAGYLANLFLGMYVETNKAYIAEVAQGRDKLVNVVQDNTASNRETAASNLKLSTSVEKLTEEIRKKN